MVPVRIAARPIDLEATQCFEIVRILPKYGVPLIEAEYKLEAVAAEAEVAAALRVKQGSQSSALNERRTQQGIGQSTTTTSTAHYGWVRWACWQPGTHA
jgi:hypothetical protein